MATREEKLKKINAELEQLSDEELEKISGGTTAQTAGDSALLYAYGLLGDYHDSIHTMFHWKSDSAAVDAGWSKAGITCVTRFFDEYSNKYFLDGKKIKRQEAINYLKANFKQIHKIP